MTDSNSTHL